MKRKMKNITVVLALIVFPLTASASLLEKAKIISAIMENASINEIVDAFGSSNSNIGNSIESFARFGEDSKVYLKMERILRNNLGEVTIKYFSVAELRAVKELHDEGGKKQDFALRILCMPCGNDSFLNQRFNELRQYQSSRPPPSHRAFRGKDKEEEEEDADEPDKE